MIETPSVYPAYPGADLRPFATGIGSVPTPLAPDEPCPILFRDAGPDGVGNFLEGILTTLAGREAPVVFLRSAGVPFPTRAAEEFGELILVRPMALHPWRTSEAGVYVVARDASPVGVGFLPPGTDRIEIARVAAAMVDERELREHLGTDYGEALARIRAYQEERAAVEAIAGEIRRRYGEVRPDLERAGVTEAEIFGPWFEVAPDRRREIREILEHLPPTK